MYLQTHNLLYIRIVNIQLIYANHNRKLNAKIMIKLKDSIIAQIKKEKKLVRALEDEHGKAPYTLQTWLRENNPMLCIPSSLKIIAEHLKKDVKELVDGLEDEIETAEALLK